MQRESVMVAAVGQTIVFCGLPSAVTVAGRADDKTDRLPHELLAKLLT